MTLPALVNPPQPNEPNYPIDELATATEYSYESYIQAFGSAPPYDPSWYVQYWGDPAAANLPALGPGVPAFYTYSTWQVSADGSSVSIVSKTIPASRASLVNIPPPIGGVVDSEGTLNPSVRPLETGASAETLFVQDVVGIPNPMVSRADMQGNTAAPGGWTVADRAALFAVKAKIGA